MEYDTNMPTENTTQPPSLERSSSRYKNTIIGAAAVFVFVAVCFGAWLIQSRMQSGAVSADFTPAGMLYLSGALVTAPSSSAIYSFDIASKTFTQVTAPKAGSDWGPTVTPNGLLYVSSQTVSGAFARVSQLFDLSSTGSTTQVSDTQTLWKRAPQYSSALGQVVYEGRKTVAADSLNSPSGSATYLLVDKQEGKFITTGSLPALTPDGKSVVVLRDDGLYMSSLVATSTAQKIWSFDGGRTGMQDQFSISPDGKNIVWTVPDRGHIYMMRVDSWAPFSGRVTKDIAVPALWPRLSPDGNYLTYVAIDLASSTPSNPRLVVQLLSTGAKQTLRSLSDFDAKTLFVSEWGS